MVEEYKVLEEIEEHEQKMIEARKVGKNVNALVLFISRNPAATIEKLEANALYPELTEYTLGVMEGMGLVNHLDMDGSESDG